MPVIQQEGRVKSVKGLPLRWGVKAYRELHAARGNAVTGDMPERYKRLSSLLDDVINAPLPLDATDAQICIKAQEMAQTCAGFAETVHDLEVLRMQMRWECLKLGIAEPAIQNTRQYLARCMDPAWWRRQLRTVHGRKFEHAAIRLGFVSSKSGIYASDETVKRRIEQNKRNSKILASTFLQNDLEQEYSLADLVAKSVSNKKNRRGELMLRIKGFEVIAKECGHDGIFVTLTAPSRFHGVLQGSNQTNPKYDGSTPIDAQLYLRKVWARIRAALAREGIALYGFRIAEPHHDGCPHWHMLLFVQPFYRSRGFAMSRLSRIFKRYAWDEQDRPLFPVYALGGGFIPRMEPGRAAAGVKIVKIDWSHEGGAAGYIAKYVGKNIDDAHVGEHTEDGVTVGPDLVGDDEIKPCQRVEAWAAKWGIRQFQQIGGAPVTVWRELRRLREETARRSLDPVLLKAWEAAQRVEVPVTVLEEDGTRKAVMECVKPADFAQYLEAQGGAVVGRQYNIKVAMREAEIEGRYGLTLGKKPVGVFLDHRQNEVWESVRYQWKRTGRAVGLVSTWTRVNNCTRTIEQELTIQGDAPEEFDLSDWYESQEFRKIEIPTHEIDEKLPEMIEQARERRKVTRWTERGGPRKQVAHGWTVPKPEPEQEPVWDFGRRYNAEGKLLND